MLQTGWTGGLVTLSACATHHLLALSCAGAAAGALRWCEDDG
jgi:hypothetical protein